MAQRAESTVAPEDPAERRLVVVCGVPGTGKTTVARHLGDAVGADIVRTDVVRTERFPSPTYTNAETREVYEAVLDRGRRTLADGRSAVLDGTFRKRRARDRAGAVAAAADVPCDFVKVECAEAVLRERIRARTDDESEADFSDHLALKTEFEALTRPHVTIDNSGSLAATKRQLRDRMLAPTDPARELALDGGRL